MIFVETKKNNKKTIFIMPFVNNTRNYQQHEK
jgi:hypothetical protein